MPTCSKKKPQPDVTWNVALDKIFQLWPMEGKKFIYLLVTKGSSTAFRNETYVTLHGVDEKYLLFQSISLDILVWMP